MNHAPMLRSAAGRGARAHLALVGVQRDRHLAVPPPQRRRARPGLQLQHLRAP